jgi:Tfp pilus assembly protein PilZ
MRRFDFNCSIDLKSHIRLMQKNDKTDGIKFDLAGFYPRYFTIALLCEQQGNEG